MSAAIVVFAAILGVAAGIGLSWAWLAVQPSRAVALPDPEMQALARHEQARAEIQTIERVTRQLMRAAASSGAPSPGAATPQAPPGTPTHIGELSAEPGFAWSPDPVAGSSSSAGCVRFSASNPWRS
jgi:hypothetical protein